MRALWLISLLYSIPALAFDNEVLLKNLINLKRIAFGSCNNQEAYQPIWRDALKQNPDLWIWGGDNIYADWTRQTMQEAYLQQNRNRDYQIFKSQTPIIGTWDDHDYAYDNANGYYANKEQSQKLFLDFLGVPPDSPRRQQPGIYTVHHFGRNGRKIKIIMLDNRYFKNLEVDYPLLGKKQWEWLEEELTNSDASLHFIVTGLSVLSPLLPYTEEWGHTNELDRMLELLKRTSPKGVVFLTGDKHFSSIFRRWGHLEFMSSGMTHIAPRKTWWYLGRQYPITYFGLSYGQIDIKWEEDIPVLIMSMRTPSGRDVYRSVFKWEGTRWQPVWDTKDWSFPVADNLLAQP
jgi:alkaline phosphatase D